jgi:hypothetical protein
VVHLEQFSNCCDHFGCHCWLVQQCCLGTGGQAIRGTRHTNLKNALANSAQSHFSGGSITATRDLSGKSREPANYPLRIFGTFPRESVAPIQSKTREIRMYDISINRRIPILRARSRPAQRSLSTFYHTIRLIFANTNQGGAASTLWLSGEQSG